MGAGPLDLAFTISADPSQAQAALAELKASNVAGAADISSRWLQAMNAMTRPADIALGAIGGLSKAHVELTDRVAELSRALLDEDRALEVGDHNREEEARYWLEATKVINKDALRDQQEMYKEMEEKGRRAFENLKQKSQELRQEFILQHTALRLLAADGYGGLIPAFQAAAASLDDFRNLSLNALNAFEQAMGSSIAMALVYEKSIGAAMASALKATLASLSAEAYVQAIKATALGFLRLAEYDFPAAAQAFESAGLWAAVGTAAGVAGRAVPSTAAERRASPGFGGLVLGRGAEVTGPGTAPLAAGVPPLRRAAGSGGQAVTVIFQGPVYGGKAGLDELIGHISDAVDRRDVRLSATTIKDTTLTRDSFNG
jgi:hypothetical protein